MNAKKWSEHNWAAALKALGIKHRKFYATRHTFITEAIKRGENILAVAQYCGTSVAMIQKDYCGPLGLALDPTAVEPQTIAQQPTNQAVVEPDQTIYQTGGS
jgi:integrase